MIQFFSNRLRLNRLLNLYVFFPFFCLIGRGRFSHLVESLCRGLRPIAWIGSAAPLVDSLTLLSFSPSGPVCPFCFIISLWVSLSVSMSCAEIVQFQLLLTVWFVVCLCGLAHMSCVRVATRISFSCWCGILLAFRICAYSSLFFHLSFFFKSIDLTTFTSATDHKNI